MHGLLPTRAAILTGKYPARLHLTDWIPGHERPRAKLRIPEWTQYLPREEVTVAEVLKGAGYATASIGKWHLGGREFWPESQGFDVNKGDASEGSRRATSLPTRSRRSRMAPPASI